MCMCVFNISKRLSCLNRWLLGPYNPLTWIQIGGERRPSEETYYLGLYLRKCICNSTNECVLSSLMLARFLYEGVSEPTIQERQRPRIIWRCQRYRRCRLDKPTKMVLDVDVTIIHYQHSQIFKSGGIDTLFVFKCVWDAMGIKSWVCIIKELFRKKPTMVS